MTVAEQNELAALRARVAQIDAEAAEKRAAALNKPLTFKVGQSGAVSVYGMQRFPTTLYANQWERLIKNIPALQAFIASHSAELAVKDA